MKAKLQKTLLYGASLLCLLITTGYTQDASEKTAENVTMREGTFWANHAVEGKNFYNGQWYDGVAPESQGWLPQPDQYYADLLNDYLTTNQGTTLDQFFQSFSGMTYQQYVDANPDVPYPARGLAFEYGLGYPTSPTTNEERAAFLQGLEDGTITTEALNNLMNYTVAPMSVPTTPEETLFAQQTLEKIQQTTGDPWQVMFALQKMAEYNSPAPGLDLSNIVFDPAITYSVLNLENATISTAQLNTINNLTNTKLGAKNLTGYDPSGKWLSYVDFSQTTGLNASALSSAGTVAGSNFSGLNLTGFNPNGKSLQNTNLSNTTGLTVELIASASDLQNLNLTGTGISKAALDAALVAANRNPNAGAFNTNTITGLLP